MCAIVGAIAQSNSTPILVNGLKRLEYRGYDSAGIAVIDKTGEVQHRPPVDSTTGLYSAYAIAFLSCGTA